MSLRWLSRSSRSARPSRSFLAGSLCDRRENFAPLTPRGAARDVAGMQLQAVVADGGVGPADDLAAPEHGEGVVTADALGRRGVGFEAVGPAPEMLEALAVPDDGIEGGEQSQAFVEHRIAGEAEAGGVFVGGPEPAAAVDCSLWQSRVLTRQCCTPMLAPLRGGGT